MKTISGRGCTVHCASEVIIFVKENTSAPLLQIRTVSWQPSLKEDTFNFKSFHDAGKMWNLMETGFLNEGISEYTYVGSVQLALYLSSERSVQQIFLSVTLNMAIGWKSFESDDWDVTVAFTHISLSSQTSLIKARGWTSPRSRKRKLRNGTSGLVVGSTGKRWQSSKSALWPRDNDQGDHDQGEDKLGGRCEGEA